MSLMLIKSIHISGLERHPVLFYFIFCFSLILKNHLAKPHIKKSQFYFYHLLCRRFSVGGVEEAEKPNL